MANGRSDKIACAIIGASGYTGEELVRILAHHPNVDIKALTSRQSAGLSPEVTWNLYPQGNLPDFEDLEPTDLLDRADVFFLALPHGVSAQFGVPLLDAGKTVIDLSADFRLNRADVYEQTYGQPHPAPALLEQAAYGLVEWNREALRNASLIACPGCYPTSAQLPLIPLLREGLIAEGDIIISALSGVSGAGKKADLFYSFCERAECLTAYGLPQHRHVPEIEQECSRQAGRPVRVHFAPHLVPSVRGMLSTISVPIEVSIEVIQNCLRNAYEKEPFVRYLNDAAGFPTSGAVAGSNLAQLAARASSTPDRAWLLCSIDNLGKGAGGQAVQAFNCRFGLPEGLGLGARS